MKTLGQIGLRALRERVNETQINLVRNQDAIDRALAARCHARQQSQYASDSMLLSESR